MNEKQKALVAEMLEGFTKLKTKNIIRKRQFEDLIGLYVTADEIAEILTMAGFDVEKFESACRVNLSISELNMIGSRGRLSYNKPFYTLKKSTRLGGSGEVPPRITKEMKEHLKFFDDAQARLFLYTAEVTDTVVISKGLSLELEHYLDWDKASDRVIIQALEEMGELD